MVQVLYGLPATRVSQVYLISENHKSYYIKWMDGWMNERTQHECHYSYEFLEYSPHGGMNARNETNAADEGRWSSNICHLHQLSFHGCFLERYWYCVTLLGDTYVFTTLWAQLTPWIKCHLSETLPILIWESIEWMDLHNHLTIFTPPSETYDWG